MPTLNIDQFDTEPKVGDKVRVEGKVKSINTDTGEVDVSYDNVDIVNKRKKSSSNSDSTDNIDNTDKMTTDNNPGMNLDQALQNSFGYTQ